MIVFVGSLKDVINENAVTTGIRKFGNAVDRGGEAVGELVGKAYGGVSAAIAPSSHLPGFHGLNKGFAKGLNHGYDAVDKEVDNLVRRPIGKALGAYDDEKKKDREASKK